MDAFTELWSWHKAVTLAQSCDLGTPFTPATVSSHPHHHFCSETHSQQRQTWILVRWKIHGCQNNNILCISNQPENIGLLVTKRSDRFWTDLHRQSGPCLPLHFFNPQVCDECWFLERYFVSKFHPAQGTHILRQSLYKKKGSGKQKTAKENQKKNDCHFNFKGLSSTTVAVDWKEMCFQRASTSCGGIQILSETVGENSRV